MSTREPWQELTLEEVVEDITVGHVGPMATEYRDSGVAFLRSQNVRAGWVDLEDVKYVSPEFHAKLRNSALLPGDVIVVRTGAPGTAAVVPPSLQPLNCADLVIIRPNKRLHPRIISYVFNSNFGSSAVRTQLVGAVQQHFNVGSARKMRLQVPPPREQDAIVAILGTLDDKIDLNRRTNETLDQMTAALFKNWFIDFDPVRAKAEGSAPFGMDADTAALFPREFEHSRLGEIPKGFRIDSLDHGARLLSGGTPSTERAEYWSGDIAWASAKDVSQCRDTFLLSTERSITRLGLEESPTQIVPALSTLVVARGATTGRMGLASRDMAMNQTCYALASTWGTPFFLHLLVRVAMPSLVHGAHGSVFDTITTRSFAACQTVFPPQRCADVFERRVNPLFSRLLANTKEVVALAETRDALLPNLLSGELRLKDAERFVADVT